MISTVTNETNDINRYTSILSVDKSKYVATKKKFVSKGYELVSVKNTLKNQEAEYRRINNKYMDSNAVILELQFYTQKSFDIKQSNHLLYEKTRQIGISKDESYKLFEE